MRNLAIFLALLAGCGNGESGGGSGSSSGSSTGSYDAAADQTVKAMKEFGDILESVTDKASAEAAKPKLEALAKRLGDIVMAVAKLGPPSDQQAGRTEEKMRAGLQSMSSRVTGYIERIITSPVIAPVLEQPFAAVQSKLMQLRGLLGG